MKSFRRLSFIAMLSSATTIVVLIMYLCIPESAIPSSSSSLESFYIPSFNGTFSEYLTFSPISTGFNFSEEFHHEKSSPPEIASHYPDESQRQFPYPFVSGDMFRFTSDFIFDENDYRNHWGPGHVGSCQTVFVKNNLLGDFFDDVFPHIRHPFILISHNGDDPAPGRFHGHLADPRIYSWFAQNLDGTQHMKLRPIPIGITNSQWETGNLNEWRRALSRDLPGWDERDTLLFINWTDVNNPIRKLLKEKFRHFTKDTVVGEGNHEQFLHNLTRTKFVLSPPGKGIDCHRHWEAILMGAVPIVLRSGLDPLFQNAPAVVVDDFNDISEDLLRALRPSESYNRRIMWANLWLGMIKNSVQECLARRSES